jgi:hypothetical protein
VSASATNSASNLAATCDAWVYAYSRGTRAKLFQLYLKSHHFHAGQCLWVGRVRVQTRHGPPFQGAPDVDRAVGEHFRAGVHAAEHEEAVARRRSHLLPAPHAALVHLIEHTSRGSGESRIAEGNGGPTGAMCRPINVRNAMMPHRTPSRRPVLGPQVARRLAQASG